jgi:hypothetical protein
VPAKSQRLLALAALLAIAAVVVAVWAGSAYRYSSRVRHWPVAQGTVVTQPDDRAAVRFPDAAGGEHLWPLHSGDTDDLPVGSKVDVVYHLAADGRLSTEFRFQPGARASALTVLALLAALGSGVAGWRARQEHRAEGSATSGTGH